MKAVGIVYLALCLLPAGTFADRPPVSRSMIESMQKSLDQRLSRLWPDDPAEVLGLTEGAYINGYGAVFMAETNLAPAAGISPFHPSVTPDEVKRTHDKKLARVAKLREAMRGMLADSAKSLDALPADDQITVGVSLFYWNWENRAGLPAQIVMHASRRALLQAGAAPDKAPIATDEY
jgi:hypothetical protein